MGCSCTPGRHCLHVSKKFENVVIINHSVKQTEKKKCILSTETWSHMPGQSCEFSKYNVRWNPHLFCQETTVACVHVCLWDETNYWNLKVIWYCFPQLRNYCPNDQEKKFPLQTRKCYPDSKRVKPRKMAWE